MAFSIANDYSVLNDYNYEGKSYFVSYLDFFSAPCRMVFGGRKVNVLSQCYDNPMSMKGRFFTLLFCAIVYPIGVVSLGSLALKSAIMPWFWQKRIVQVQSQQTVGLINIFEQAVRNNDVALALTTFHQRPQIRERGINLYPLFKQRIKDLSGWDNIIEDSIIYLIGRDAKAIIKEAVKLRLENELKNIAIFSISAEEIFKLACRTLLDEDCCKEILQEILQIVPSQGFEIPFKLELANGLIFLMMEKKRNEKAKEGNLFILEPIEKNQLYDYVFPSLSIKFCLNQQYVEERVCLGVQSIRDLNKEVKNLFVKLIALGGIPLYKDISQEIGEFSQYVHGINESERAVCSTFKAQLECLAKFTKENQKEDTRKKMDLLDMQLKSQLAEFNDDIDDNLSHLVLKLISAKRFEILGDVCKDLKKVLL